MLHFDLVNGVAVIDATTLMTIPKLKKLYKKLEPNLRDRVFTYIHVTARIDDKAPYFNASFDEIFELGERHYFDDDNPFPNPLRAEIKEACEIYLKAFETAEIRMLKVFDKKLDQIRIKVDDTEPEIVKSTNSSGVVSFSSNIDIITKALDKIDSLMITKSKLEAKIRKESDGKGSVRGKKRPSRLERRSLMER